MSTTLPRPTTTRPSLGPPNIALPSLPVNKTRKGLSVSPPRQSIPRSGFRSPVPPSSLPPSPGPAPTTALPQPTPKTLHKAVSISAFPQPPRGDFSTPNSPIMSTQRLPTRKTLRPPSSPALASSSEFEPKPPPSPSAQMAGTRISDGGVSVPSPTHSRCSSAQDSYSTSATNYDDFESPRKGNSARNSAEASALPLKGDKKGNVLVSVRVRPESNPANAKTEAEWAVDSQQSLIHYRGKDAGSYHYDNVFCTDDDNSKVYDHSAKRLVRRVMEGYHGTVFAYGMTGTGKTFSMQGTASSPGVIPLAITDIFSYIRETPSREFLLRVSYLEIYNEKIHDLLSMSTNGGVMPQEEIKLREDSKGGVYATPLKEEIVQSPTQLLRVIARGDQARRTASTQFNARSSRSHAIVQIVVESRERVSGVVEAKRSGIPPGGVRVSTLSLIDLAGSEKAADSKERRTEGSHINKSLLTLGTVISKLSEVKDKSSDGAAKHLPYRDSKLTRLLQGALSGNSLVSILCTIQTGAHGSAAAVSTHITETLNTLKFASRAKNNIVSHAKRAEEALGEGGTQALLERYRSEIAELRRQLEQQSRRKENNVRAEAAPVEAVVDKEEERLRAAELEQRHEEQLLEMQLARTALKERIDHLNRLILSSKSIGVNNSRFSLLSTRSSVTQSGSTGSILRRTSSSTSASTIGAPLPIPSFPSDPNIGGRLAPSSTDNLPSASDEDNSPGDFGDGSASLLAQNQALRIDLADKNRYIATLEKRLLQARRTSSRTSSLGYAGSSKNIMVGEDHSVAAVIKEKDNEIAELRARLDDKDRMLAALRAPPSSSSLSSRNHDSMDSMHSEFRLPSRLAIVPPPSGPPPVVQRPGPPVSAGKMTTSRSLDEMKILDDMIADRIEAGHLVKSQRGSVRVAKTPPTWRLDTVTEPKLESPAERSEVSLHA